MPQAKINGVNLYYQVEGEGEAVLFIMGTGLTHALWSRQIDAFSRTAPGATPEERRQAAIGSWSAMVGAVILARMSDDPALADEVLAETRAFIDRAQ